MKLHISVAVRAGLLVLAPAVLCACKGRTAENMVPTGDTVEVVISHPADSSAEATTALSPADVTPADSPAEATTAHSDSSEL